MNLEDSRKKIDETDSEILRLFSQRMKIVDEVAEYKKKNNMQILNQSRERSLLDNIVKSSEKGLEMQSKLLFRTIIEISKARQAQYIYRNGEISASISAALESTPKVFPQSGMIACQGIEGAYSQIAADKLFPLGQLMYFKNFGDVFRAVENGMCDYGVLPIENSSYGTVNEVYDLMCRYNFSIVRSLKQKIDHCLLAKKSTDISGIKEIYSHSQAIGQCSRFLSAHPEIKVNICENTAVAAQIVSRSERDDIAAVSSRSCEKIYSLSKVICNEKIQNSDSNYTRFICISKKAEIYPAADKISLMVTLEHTPGSLYSFISKFASLGLNLTKIESRPIEGSDFEFRFFIDFHSSLYCPEILALLDELKQSCEEFAFLGGYYES